MKENEIREALVLLYDRRLKSLLCYQDSRFTKELVDYMFDRFAQISTHQPRQEFGNNMITSISSVMEYPRNPYKGLRDIQYLLLNLNEYVQECYISLFGQASEEELAVSDYRSRLGSKFREALMTYNKGRFPRFQYNNTVAQLRHVTDRRNQLAHPERQGLTGRYDRYSMLATFDTLLCYLLYSFYHMALNRDYSILYLH